MNKHTPPQVHLSPAWRPRDRGGKSQGPGRAGLPNSRRTRGDSRDRELCSLGPRSSPEPLPVCYPHQYPPAPSRRLHRAAWPRGPALAAAGRMRSANAAPVGFLLNCRAAAAAAAAAQGSAGGTQGQLGAHSPRLAPLVLKPVARAAHPRAPPRLHTHGAHQPRRQGPRGAAVLFSAQVKTKAADESRLLRGTR